MGKCVHLEVSLSDYIWMSHIPTLCTVLSNHRSAIVNHSPHNKRSHCFSGWCSVVVAGFVCSLCCELMCCAIGRQFTHTQTCRISVLCETPKPILCSHAILKDSSLRVCAVCLFSRNTAESRFGCRPTWILWSQRTIDYIPSMPPKRG